ncbi:antA/AntB antirepressor family protein [uncultured Helicobacter sp.]|uniref:antA/AntB antirepressor family protein n=1 Tax=uncultured Helicobacter sp. TaxID=175537 RepID=UPI00374EDA5C
MNELFVIEPIKIGTKAVNAINARELHQALHSKQDFSTWIKKRLETCGAKEGEDYICWGKVLKPASQIDKNDRLGQIFSACFLPPKERAKIEQEVQGEVFHKTMENPKHIESSTQSIASLENTSVASEIGGRPKIEYIITLELAKHIAMLEKNEIGRHIRQYFIDFESAHRDSALSTNPISVQGLLAIAKNQIAAIEKTQESLAIVAQKVQHLESTKRLEGWQERALSDGVKAKVRDLTKGREVSPKVVSAYYRAIYKRLKGKYYVARYSEIPCLKFDEALAFVEAISSDDLIS